METSSGNEDKNNTIGDYHSIQHKTAYDDEIATLEAEKIGPEAEKNDIQSGHFKMTGGGGGVDG